MSIVWASVDERLIRVWFCLISCLFVLEGSKLQIKEPTEGGLSLSRLPMLNLDNDDIEDIYQAYPGLPPPLDISNGSRRQEDKQQIFNFSEAQRLELTSRQNEMTNGHLMMWNDRKGGSPSTTRPWPINR